MQASSHAISTKKLNQPCSVLECCFVCLYVCPLCIVYRRYVMAEARREGEQEKEGPVKVWFPTTTITIFHPLTRRCRSALGGGLGMYDWKIYVRLTRVAYL